MNKKSKKIRVILLSIACVVLLSIVGLMATVKYHRSLYAVNGSAMSPALNSGETVKVSPYKKGSVPQRGDIVVFDQKGEEGTTRLIKRVVALPRERITISGGKVTIFNKSYPTGFNPDAYYLKDQTTTLGNNDVTIPGNQFYVLGDNRVVSLDSRIFGPIALESIIGKVNR